MYFYCSKVFHYYLLFDLLTTCISHNNHKIKYVQTISPYFKTSKVSQGLYTHSIPPKKKSPVGHQLNLVNSYNNRLYLITFTVL